MEAKALQQIESGSPSSADDRQTTLLSMPGIDRSALDASVQKFIKWMDRFGESSYDFQSVYAGPIGGSAKRLYYRYPRLGVLAVAPMVFTEAFFPPLKALFWKKQRFAIADAHYAMGFALLFRTFDHKSFYRKALHFLNILEQTRCPEYPNYCWGYPFDWRTKYGTLPTGTPLITTTPYAYEAFEELYRIDQNPKWLEIMHSVAEHARCDIKDKKTSEHASMCSYTPDDIYGVINANAYRSFLLTSASVRFSDPTYFQIGERNLNFVLESQRADGSWLYSYDGINTFVDHYHTCFVLKALAKIDRLIGGHAGCQKALDRGVHYYLNNLFDARGLPRPFSQKPRLTMYRRELYDYAESINVCLLLRHRYAALNDRLIGTVSDLLDRWQRPEGFFSSRRLLFGWDNVPMHRWAQAQLFRSLCLYLNESSPISPTT